MEDKDQTLEEDPRQTLRPTGGRDELNLAEFPITLLSDRVPKDCKTLEFEIEPRDIQTGKTVSRKVTITGSDKYGLPRALDDEILVALVQLTKLKNGFTNPLVQFSRYEVLKLLGWPDDGRSYRRVEESIRRWAGVTLYYDNAWWNKEANSWMSETFHVIERSSIISQESRRARKQTSNGQYELPLSVFKWNEVVFRSFESGALKRLDVDAYFSLSSSVAKRMYRFLDKRFWVKNCWQFDLKEFAFEHIGLSRKYNVAQIKNKLRPAIEELSTATAKRAAFLESADGEQRFKKLAKGQWVVSFERKAQTRKPEDPPLPLLPPEGLAQELTSRGVSTETARELVADGDHEFISLRIEVFDWILENKSRKFFKESPIGYLISSIRDRYLTVPPEFESKADRQRREEARAAEKEAQRQKVLSEKAEQAREAKLLEAERSFWESLSEAEREQHEAKALTEADEELRRQYQQSSDARLKRFLMKGARSSYVRKLLEGEPAEATPTAGEVF